MIAEILVTLATFKALLSGPNLLSPGAYYPPSLFSAPLHPPIPTHITYFSINVLGEIKAQGWGLTVVVGGGLKTSREG